MTQIRFCIYDSLDREEKLFDGFALTRSFLCSSGLLFCSLLGGLIGLSYLLFDPVVKHIILNKLILRNNSEIADFWKDPPITPHFNVSSLELKGMPSRNA